MDAPSPFTATLMIATYSAIIALGIWGFARWNQMWYSGQPLQDFAARRPVPWGVIDIAIVLVLYAALQIGGAMLCLGAEMEGVDAFEDMDMGRQISMLVIMAVTSFLTLFLSVLLIRKRTGATGDDFGITATQWKQDFKSGILIFALLIVPIFALQWFLQLFADEPSHPIVRMLIDNPSAMFFLASGLAAVIAAPIVEEFLFRVLLQGWLENLALAADKRHRHPAAVTQRLVLGGRASSSDYPADVLAETLSPTADDEADTTRDPDNVASPAVASESNPYAAPRDVSKRDLLDEEDKEPPSASAAKLHEMSMLRSTLHGTWLGWLPILASALLFALAHAGHGTDPIPLFLLAIGLGWLYQRTHRMWPCVVVHMMLNGLSLFQLLLYVQGQAP